MNPAKRWYVERVYKELIRHQERIVWLSADRPVWQCGTPVDSYTRHSMLKSSVELVAIISKQLNPLRDPRNVK